MNEEQFRKNILRIANNIDETLENEDILMCLAALSLVIGACLADDVTGHYDDFEDLDVSLKVVNDAVRAAYYDFKGVQ